MQPQIRQQLPQAHQTDQVLLISRSQMITIATTFNIRVTMSTIHRWANEPDFPMVMGQDGRTLLYAKEPFVTFLKKRLKKLQEDR